ncbi:MAG: beta-N-acetylhexosaminidase, partial [Chloroflexi bacterium]|nr:beta-N-acetylhexosaminidase [Chloroflexota bacterium]
MPNSITQSPNTPISNFSSLTSKTIDDLLASMSLADKIGQTLMIGIDGPTLTHELRDTIAQLRVGGVILYERNVESPRQLAQLDADLQNFARERGLPGLFISIDQEGGVVARLKEEKGFTEFPSAMAISATDNVENARRIAQIMADELLAVGINMDLTPDLDVNINPLNPIIGTRAFGSDPARVAEYGIAFAESLQARGVIAIGKHFPGHGDTGVDSHIALPTIPYDRARLERVEFVPFRAAMRAQIAGIMSAHITFPAIDPTPSLAATLSPRVMTDLLRGEMKYDGLLMTDSVVMGALATSGYPAPQAAATSLKAGADILLFQNGYAVHRQAFDLIQQRVERGEISQDRINESVKRILIAKQKYNLLAPPTIDVENAAARVGTRENKNFSRAVAAQSITLVRDNANLIPLSPTARLFVVEAGNLGLGNALNATTVMNIAAQPKADVIATIVARGKEDRTVIVATSDAARNRAQIDLVNALVQANVPTIVIAMRGPYDAAELKAAPTILLSYGANPPCAEAVANILLGKMRAQGKLPV